MDHGSRPSGGSAPSGTSQRRENLKKRLFRKCDRDGDGVLNKVEMRELAGLVGFEGSEAEWNEEYQKLCDEQNISTSKGISQALVMQLLDDDSDSGCYCTDKELQDLLAGDHIGAGSRPSGSSGALEPSGRGSRPDPKSSSLGDDACKVFFAGANFNTEEADLQAVFAEVGKIEEFSLFRMPDHRSRGMGIVIYSSPSEAKKAIDYLHQREVDGRSLLVQEDTRREPGAKGGRRYEEEWYDDPWYDGWGEGPWGKGKGSSKGWKGGGKDGKDRKGGHDEWGKGGKRKGRDEWGTGKGHDDYWGPEYDEGPVDYYGYETDGYTVFFAGASFDTTPTHLRKQFQEAGRILQFWLFQLPDGRSRGMGVVQYERPSEAQYAVDLMHMKTIDGRCLMVKIDDVGALATEGMGYDNGKSWDERGAKPSKYCPTVWSNRVFFAGAPFHCSEAAIRSYFAELGTIRSFTVFWSEDGRHRGMGVCTFSSNSEAEAALHGGIVIEGRPLFLQEDTSKFLEAGAPPKRRDEPGFGSSESSSKKGRNGPRSQQYEQHVDSYSLDFYKVKIDASKAVFFANVAFETTETYLKSKFEEVGPVNHLVLFMTQDGRSRGMGVVEYKSQGAAMRAYNVLHETTVSGRTIVVDEYRPAQR